MAGGRGGRGWQGVAGGGRGMKSDDLEPHEAKVNYIQVLFLTSSNKIKLKSQVPLETVIKEGGVSGGGRGRQGTPGDARGRQGAIKRRWADSIQLFINWISFWLFQ